MGRAVAERGWAGIFSMGTVPEARRQGAARALLTALVRWAASQDAHTLYLQVEEANAAARGLYEGVGFTVSHPDHDRTVDRGQ